ncbi:MAG: hypothetical protein QXX99_07680 [Candidatus Bathyarchaeia archaeon]
MKNEIYDYEERLERYRRVIAGFGHNGEVALHFLDHLASLGLLTARLSKVASRLPALLRAIDFDLEGATSPCSMSLLSLFNSTATLIPRS